MSHLIYVTEDDEGIRETITIALKNFSYQVKAFASAEDAFAACREQVPDLFLFDIMLPQMDGIRAVQYLRGQPETAETPVLLLTAKDTELDKVMGLDAGADDYLAKPFGVLELAARIRALLRRTRTEEVLLTAEGLKLNSATREVHLEGSLISLTYKEFDLLALLMRNRNRIVPREELLDRVWGYDFEGEVRTLDTHIKSLRHKLGDTPGSPCYITTIRNVGYRFTGAKQ